MEEAEMLCDRLGIFVDGRLVCIGNPKEITSRYGGFLVSWGLIGYQVTHRVFLMQGQSLCCMLQSCACGCGTQGLQDASCLGVCLPITGLRHHCISCVGGHRTCPCSTESLYCLLCFLPSYRCSLSLFQWSRMQLLVIWCWVCHLMHGSHTVWEEHLSLNCQQARWVLGPVDCKTCAERSCSYRADGQLRKF